MTEVLLRCGGDYRAVGARFGCCGVQKAGAWAPAFLPNIKEPRLPNFGGENRVDNLGIVYRGKIYGAQRGARRGPGE